MFSNKKGLKCLNIISNKIYKLQEINLLHFHHLNLGQHSKPNHLYHNYLLWFRLNVNLCTYRLKWIIWQGRSSKPNWLSNTSIHIPSVIHWWYFICRWSCPGMCPWGCYISRSLYVWLCKALSTLLIFASVLSWLN